MDKEDQIFEFLTKIYSEVQGFKGEMQGVKGKMQGFKEKQDSLENVVTRIEQNHGQKLDALLDGYKQLAESQEVMKDDIETLKTDMKMVKLVLTKHDRGIYKKAK